MTGFLAKKLIYLPLITAIMVVMGVFGYIAQANNDIVVFGKVWEQGMGFWGNSVSVEPGQEFKITLFAGNYSQSQPVTNVKILDNLPANTSYVASTSFQILNNDGVWQALADDGTTPFDGAGLAVTADGTLNAQEFANYKYTVKVADFLSSGTTVLSWSGPTLYFTDAFGNQTKNNTETISITVSNLPSISSFTLSPVKSSYKLGDVITFTSVGTAGKTGTVQIGSATVNLTDTGGTYTGTYTVQAGDNISGVPRVYLATAGKGAYSDYSQSITVDGIVPGSPTGLSAVLNGDNTVTLGWIAAGASGEVDHYNIYSNNGSGNVDFNTPIATALSTATQYTTAVLTVDVLYKFAVRSVDSSGNTDGNTIVISKSTDITPPEPPASLVQPTSLNSQILKFQISIPINFVWASSPAADLVRYRLEIDDSSDFSSIITSQETADTTTAYTLQTSTVSLPEGIYFWRVSAIDDALLVSTPATTPDNSFEIDNTASTITITQPTSGSQVGATFSITGTAADSGSHLAGTTGIQKVEVFLTNFTTNQHWNGTSWVASSTFLTATSTNGFAAWSYQFSNAVVNNNVYITGARVTDKAGHQTDNGLISLVGDTVVPTVNLVTLTNTTLGSTSFFKNGQSIILTATITDNLGQGSMGTSTISANLLAITGNAADNAIAPASYNTTTGLATWAEVTASTPTDGAKSVVVTATDLAGNSGTGSNSITADNTVPAITAATLTSPSDTGIALSGSSSKNITWDNTQITDTNLAVNPITLEYSTDGSNWTQIAANEANDGTYAWTVPGLNIATVRIRLTAKDAAGNTAADSSDNDFTIDSAAPTFANTVLTNSTLSITTFVKNGDTVILTSDITDNLLQAGMTEASFTANFTNITNNAGDNAVVPASYNPATGTAVWNFKTIAGTGNGNLSISITAIDPAGNSATYTNTAIIVADNTVPAITAATLTSPSNTGITWAGSSSKNITWDNTDITDTNLAANPIILEYTTDGANYTVIATSEANDGAYVWSLPSLNSQTVKVRVTASDKAGNAVTDVSDNNFTIDSTAPAVTTAALTTPNGGEAWKQGTVRNITWNTAAVTDNFGLSASPITLEYSTDGSNWTSIATGEANDGAYSWSTSVIDSTTVRVRLTATDAAGLANSDMSDLTFSIGLPPVIVKAWAASDTLIGIEWSKPLALAGSFANYTATGITSTAAVINGSDNKVVDLTVNALNNTGFTASDLVAALNTVTDTFNFQNEATAGMAIADLQAPQLNVPNSYPNTNQLIVDSLPTVQIVVSEAPGPNALFELNGVAQTISYNAANKMITFTPNAPLPAGKQTISLYMVDLANNPAALNPTYNFWIDSFTVNTTLAPVSFLFNGNLYDDGSTLEQQSITVSTYGAGFKVYAFFQPDFGDSFGNFITDVDVKPATTSWTTSKIDLNRTTPVELVSVAKAAIPSDSLVSNSYTYDLRASLPSLAQAAGSYQGTLNFIVVPEY